MAKTLTAAQLGAFSQSGVQWLWHVQIAYTGGSTYNLISGDKARFNYEPVILDFRGGRQTLDLLEYTSSIDAARFKISADWWAIHLSAPNRIQQAVVTVKLGTVLQPIADFVTVFTGNVSDYRSDGMVADVQLRDPRNKLQDLTVDPLKYPAKHPAHAIAQIWEEFLDPSEFTDPWDGTSGASDIFSGTIYAPFTTNGLGVPYGDADSLVPGTDQAFNSYPPSLGFNGLEPVNALDFINILAKSIQCVVVGGGPLKLVGIHDQATTSSFIATLTENDCMFEAENALENWYNRILVNWATRLTNDRIEALRLDATQSQANGTSISEMEVEFPPTEAFGLIKNNFNKGATEITLGNIVSGSLFTGISNNEDYETFSSAPFSSATSYDTSYQLSSTRLCYLLIAYDLRSDVSGATFPASDNSTLLHLDQCPEIIGIDGWHPHVNLSPGGGPDTTLGASGGGTIFTGETFQAQSWLPPGGSGVLTGQVAGSGTSRGLFGTIESAWVKNVSTTRYYRPYAYDITVPLIWARTQLSRYSEGAPVITAMTSGRYLNLEIGDAVKVDSRRITYYRNASASSSTDDRWRVVGVKRDPFSGEGLVELTLMLETDPAGANQPTEKYTFIREARRTFGAEDDEEEPTSRFEQQAERLYNGVDVPSDTEVGIWDIFTGTGFGHMKSRGEKYVIGLPNDSSIELTLFVNLYASPTTATSIGSRDSTLTLSRSAIGVYSSSESAATTTGVGADITYGIEAPTDAFLGGRAITFGYSAAGASDVHRVEGILSAVTYNAPP